jgi:hypothetical protein
MSENLPGKDIKDEEIDLSDLFIRMGRTLSKSIKAVGRAFVISVVFLLKKWVPIGLSLVAAVGASYLLRIATASFYTSDMTLRSNAIPSSELITYINRLHTFCLEKNSSGLAEALSFNSKSVKNIIDINAYWIIDQNNDEIPDYVDYKQNHNIYDTTNLRMQDRLDIRVKIKSPLELNILRNGIIGFIESDSLYQQMNRLRLRQNHELLTRLDYDILQLDSLQKVKYFEETRNRQPQGGGQMIFLQEQTTQLIYNDIYSLYDRKQRLESERDLYAGIITVLSDFSLPAKRENGTLYYGKYVIPIVFFLTLMILIIMTNRKKLEDLFRNY